MIDKKNQHLKIIDFDQSIMKLTGEEEKDTIIPRTVDMETPYLSPEVILGYENITYSADMWSFGCILAGWIFQRASFFNGDDSSSSYLLSIIKILGYTDFINFISLYNLQDKLDHLLKHPSKQLQNAISDSKEKNNNKTLYDVSQQLDYMNKQSLDRLIKKDNQQYVTNDAIDLISRLLVFDPKARLTSAEALQHRFFIICNQFIDPSIMNHPRFVWSDLPISIKLGSASHYDFGQKVGNGFHSDVFLAYDDDSFEYAVKVMRPNRFTRAKVLEEVFNMQVLCGGVNIIRLHDVIQNGSTYFLVEEYVKADPSFHSLYNNLSPADAKYYAYELLKGLAFAHSKRIVHRDLKPRSVMIDHDNKKLRIIDWGSSIMRISGNLCFAVMMINRMDAVMITL